MNLRRFVSPRSLDLTVLAIPAFIGAMIAEHLYQRRNPPPPGVIRPGDYELKDTIASLTMGIGSLLAPAVAKRVLTPITPGVGRWGTAFVGLGMAAGVVATAADVVRATYAGGAPLEAGTLPGRAPSRGSSERESPDNSPVLGRFALTRRGQGHGAGAADARTTRLGPYSAAYDTLSPTVEKLTAAAAVAAVASTSLAAATTWATLTGGKRLFAAHDRDLGGGALATLAAVLGWDAIYYWNHRLSHESRWLWAVHVVHHSSERYNLSTALRQSVAEGVTMTVPYGLLAWAGVRPSLIEQARALNLIYQFWIHTEVIRSIGWLEKVLNTPSHHRVHHGSNREYLDRNHGSILIIWDKLFGTFEPEGERVVYGLTRNIDSFNPVRIATHEWQDLARDVAGSRTWADRFGFLLRGPGWAYTRRAELASA